MRRAVLLLLVAALLGGCSSDDDKPAPGPDDPEAALVNVPDVAREDGAKAVAAMQQAGFKVSLEEVNGVTGGSQFKADGCTVTSQDPPAKSIAKHEAVVTLTLDCAERDWEAETGDAWDEFATAYKAGFDDGCGRLFGLTATSLLNNAGQDLTIKDCKRLKPKDAGDASTVPTQLPQDPRAAGRRYGIADGCRALFDAQGVDQLDAGDGAAVLTVADCKRAKHDVIETACKPTADFLVTPRAGSVDCSEAEQVWAQYAKATGTGGTQAPGDWKCVSASAADLPELGQCANTDGRVFTVAEP